MRSLVARSTLSTSSTSAISSCRPSSPQASAIHRCVGDHRGGTPGSLSLRRRRPPESPCLLRYPKHGRGYHRTLSMVRSTLLRGSLYRSRRWSPVLLHRSRGWSLVLLFHHTARRGSPCGSITPCRGAHLGPVSGRVLGNPLHRWDSRGLCHGLCHGLLWGSLPSDDLLIGHWLSWP